MADTEASRAQGDDTPEVPDWNQQMIAEFRANGGRLSGPFEGAPILLLHHTGAKSGTERVSPMMYQLVDDNYAVFASAAGSDRNPAWFHNLRANPNAEIEIEISDPSDDSRIQTVAVRARVADQQEREPIWVTQKERYPGFAGYEAKTERTIPVVILEARASNDA